MINVRDIGGRLSEPEPTPVTSNFSVALQWNFCEGKTRMERKRKTANAKASNFAVCCKQRVANRRNLVKRLRANYLRISWYFRVAIFIRKQSEEIYEKFVCASACFMHNIVL